MQIMNEAIEKKIEEFKERYRELNDNGSVDFRVTVGMWREAIDFGASLERTEMRKMLKGMDKDNTGYIRIQILMMNIIMNTTEPLTTFSNHYQNLKKNKL
jgi:Ca2+-binding EF-hand superfamily protein